jgi:hypothetical protein
MLTEINFNDLHNVGHRPKLEEKFIGLSKDDDNIPIFEDRVTIVAHNKLEETYGHPIDSILRTTMNMGSVRNET